MSGERVVPVEITSNKEFTPEERRVLDRFARILPYLYNPRAQTDLRILWTVQKLHNRIVQQAVAIELLPEICIIRDQFRKELANDGQV